MANFLQNLGYFGRGVAGAVAARAPQPVRQAAAQAYSRVVPSVFAAEAARSGSLQPNLSFRASPQYSGPAGPLRPSGGQVLGTTTGGGGGGGGQTGAAPYASIQAPQIAEPSGPSQDLVDLLDQDYEQTIGAIGAEESRVRSELEPAIGEVERGQAAKKTALKQEETGRLERISGREGEQQKATQGALEQLRQLYQDVQRRQLAGLSAGGLSRSSAAEAMGALLGRDMAQRVAGQVSTREEVLNNLATERKRTQDYFAGQITTLDQETQDRILQTRNQFNLALNQLNQLRGQASIEKQRGRANLFQQFQQQLIGVQQANAQAKVALDQWKQQMELKLQAAQKSAFNLASAQTEPVDLSSQGLELSQATQSPKGLLQYIYRRPQQNTLDALLNPITEEEPQFSGGF